MRQMRNACNVLVGKPNRREHSEDLGVDWRIILERILPKKFGSFALDASNSG